MITIHESKAYKIRFNFRGQRKCETFNTVRSAVKTVAWWMIFAKYDRTVYDLSMQEFAPENKSFFVVIPRGMSCDCRNDEHGSSECPIHDRENGYYARLHKRLVRFILSSHKEK